MLSILSLLISSFRTQKEAMDFDWIKSHTAETSFSFESCANSNEFQDLQFLNASASYEFPSLDDIYLPPEISKELLPYGNSSLESSNGFIAKSFQQNMDLSIYGEENHNKINHYVMESSQFLLRNSSSSSSSSSTVLVHDIEPMSVFPPRNGLLCHVSSYMNSKSMPKKRTQKKPNVVRGQWTIEEDR